MEPPPTTRSASAPTAVSSKEEEEEEDDVTIEGDDDVDIEDLELDPIAQAIEGSKFDMTLGDIKEAPLNNRVLHVIRAAAPQILAALSIVIAVSSVAVALSVRGRSRERRRMPLILNQVAIDEEQVSAENTRVE